MAILILIAYFVRLTTFVGFCNGHFSNTFGVLQERLCIFLKFQLHQHKNLHIPGISLFYPLIMLPLTFINVVLIVKSTMLLYFWI